MDHKYINRPEPSNALSGKRQRVAATLGKSAGSCIEIRQVGRLPREVDRLVQKDKLVGGRSGIQYLGGSAYGWLVTSEGRHVYLWKAREGVAAEATRLVVPQVEVETAADQHWHLSLLDAGGNAEEGEPGVFLVSSSGTAFCWPVFTAGSTPLVHELFGERGVVCTVVRRLAGQSHRIVVGTSASTLFEAQLCLEDLTLQSRQLGESRGSLISEGAALVGRWFGLKKPQLAGNGEASALEAAEEAREAVVDIAVSAFSREEAHIFVLYGQGVLRCFVLPLLDADKKIRLSWEWSRLSVETRKHLQLAQVDAVRFQRVLCPPAEASSGFVIVTAASPRGLSLHEVKGVVASTPVPRIGRHSAILEWTEDEVQVEFALLKPVSFRSCAVVALRQVSVESSVQRNALVVSSVLFPADGCDEMEWLSRRVDDVVAGEFSADATSSELAVVTSSGVLKAFVDVGVEHEGLQGNFVGAGGVDLSRSGFKGKPRRVYTESEATAIFGRVFRAFRDAALNGREGMAEVQRDEEWGSLLTALTVQMLGCAVLQVSEQEMNRKPSQRWAEKWNTNTQSEIGPSTESFSQRLVHRTLIARQATLQALFDFLQRTQLEERLPEGTLVKLMEHDEKVKAAIALCTLHSRPSAEMSQEDFTFLCGILVEAMTSVIQERDGYDTSQQVHESLRVAGLSVPDVFYAQVTGVAQVVAHMQQVAVRPDQELLKLVSVNRVCQAVYGSTIKNRSEDTLNETLPWTAGDDSLDALTEQVKLGTEKLLSIHVDESFAQVLLEQVASLGDALLQSMRDLWEFEHKQDATLYERAKDLALLPLVKIVEIVHVEKKAHVYGKDVAALALKLVDALARKHVHFESIVRLTNVQQLILGEAEGQQRLQDSFDKHLTTLFQLEADNAESALPESKTVCFRGPFGHVLAVVDGALGSVQLAELDNTLMDQCMWFKIQLLKDRKDTSGVVRWGIESIAMPGFWISIDHVNGCRLVGAKAPGTNEEFEIVEVEEMPGQYRLFYARDACLSLSSRGTLTTCKHPEEWHGMMRFCFVWFLKHDQAFRITQLTKNPAHGPEMQYLLSIAKELLPNHENLFHLVQQLKWLHSMELNKSNEAAHVLLLEAAKEKESLAQKKLMLSLAKLNLWAADEQADDRVDMELDLAAASQDVLSRLQSHNRKGLQPAESAVPGSIESKVSLADDSILTMHDIATALLKDLEIREAREFTFLIRLLKTEKMRVEASSVRSDDKSNQLSELERLKRQTWWRMLSAEYEAWMEIVEYYLENGSSEELEKRVMQTLFFHVLRSLNTDRLSNEGATAIRKEWGIDNESVRMLLECDENGQINRNALANVLVQNITAALSVTRSKSY